MSDSTTKVDEISTVLDKIKVSSSPETSGSEPHSPLPNEVDEAHFSRQPWICKADSVRHRLRGILITHDTYELFRLSFKDDDSARTFLGELLEAVSTSGHLIRMSEVQLEQVNSHWDEEARFIHPRFEPVDLPVIFSAAVVYSLSTHWEIVKTLYYVALSQDILDTLCEDAYCKVSLNALHEIKRSPVVEEAPYLRNSQQRLPADLELASALGSPSAINQKHDSTISRLIERVISMTKVGRRERSEPFLNLSEATIPRLLPRESMENLRRAIKSVYFEDFDPDKTPNFEIRGIRIFLVRRLVGTIGRKGLNAALTESLRNSTAVHDLLDNGKSSKLKVDKYADKLLRCAKNCKPRGADGHAQGCAIGGIAESMFSE